MTERVYQLPPLSWREILEWAQNRYKMTEWADYRRAAMKSDIVGAYAILPGNRIIYEAELSE
jgi:hypothetical protein